MVLLNVIEYVCAAAWIWTLFPTAAILFDSVDTGVGPTLSVSDWTLPPSTATRTDTGLMKRRGPRRQAAAAACAAMLAATVPGSAQERSALWETEIS